MNFFRVCSIPKQAVCTCAAPQTDRPIKSSGQWRKKPHKKPKIKEPNESMPKKPNKKLKWPRKKNKQIRKECSHPGCTNLARKGVV